MQVSGLRACKQRADIILAAVGDCAQLTGFVPDCGDDIGSNIAALLVLIAVAVFTQLGFSLQILDFIRNQADGLFHGIRCRIRLNEVRVEIGLALGAEHIFLKHLIVIVCDIAEIIRAGVAEDSPLRQLDALNAAASVAFRNGLIGSKQVIQCRIGRFAVKIDFGFLFSGLQRGTDFAGQLFGIALTVVAALTDQQENDQREHQNGNNQEQNQELFQPGAALFTG